MLQWILFLCVCLVSFPGNEGLDIKVSKQVPYHPLGSNVTVYCTNTFSNELDWLRGPQGKTHLAACTMNHPTSPCLPSAQIYTVDPNNSRYNMNLYNLKYSDCGTYWCKDFDERQSYTLKLIGRVDKIDKQESDGTLSITTNCVLPTSTVDIQWYYIYEGGSPRIYEKHATRTEERGQCQGVCEENNAMKISSSLTPSVVGNNVIPVKFMAYVRQGDNVQQVTFSKEYFIEDCAGSPIWHVVLFILVPSLFCIVCNIVLIVLDIRDSKPLKDNVSNMIAIWIYLVILVCFGIRSAIKEEPKLPDVFGTCHDSFSAKLLVVEVCCILIVVCLMAETIYHCLMILIQFQQKQQDSKGHKVSTIIEVSVHPGEELLLQGSSSDVDSGIQIHHVSSTPEEDIEKIKRQIEEEKNRTQGEEETKALLAQGHTQNADTSIQIPHCSSTPEKDKEKKEPPLEEEKKEKEGSTVIQRKGECDTILQCVPGRQKEDEQYVDLEGTAVLQCSLDTRDYPRWVGPDGTLINNGEQFIVGQRFSWHNDKKSLVIHEVRKSDSGKYDCYSKGARTLYLIVRLPTEPVEVKSSGTTTLKVDEKMTRDFPLWRRYIDLNAEQHEKFFFDKNAWDTDKKGLVIRNISKKDEGEYEVFANHLVKRFAIRIKVPNGPERKQEVEPMATVRLEPSCTNDNYPSWECIDTGIYNIGGDEHFQSHEGTQADNRFEWSDDKRTLIIKYFHFNDAGTYVCRHSDGTTESVILIIKGKKLSIQELERMRNQSKTV